jgi:hypothetical protein
MRIIATLLLIVVITHCCDLSFNVETDTFLS